MTHRRIVAVLGAAGVFVHAPTSNATVSKIEQKCASKMATAARKLGDTYIKVTAKCRDSDLAGKTIGACPDGKGVQAIEKAAAKLDATIAKQCGSVCSTSSSVRRWPETPDWQAKSRLDRVPSSRERTAFATSGCCWSSFSRSSLRW